MATTQDAAGATKPEEVPQAEMTDDEDEASPTAGESSPDSPKRKKKTSLKTRAGSDRDDGHNRSESHPRGQLIHSDGVVRLAGTIRIYQEKMENRFVNDFVPAPPTLAAGEKGDPLVTATLQQFASDNVVLARIRHKYEKHVPPKTKFVIYEVDEAHKLNKKAHKENEKKKVDLTNMFATPGQGSAHNTATGLHPVPSTTDAHGTHDARASISQNHASTKDKDKDAHSTLTGGSSASASTSGAHPPADAAHDAGGAGAGGTLRSRRMLASRGAGVGGAADALAGLMAAFNNPTPAVHNATSESHGHGHDGAGHGHSSSISHSNDSHAHGDGHRGSSSASTATASTTSGSHSSPHAADAAHHGHHPSVSAATPSASTTADSHHTSTSSSHHAHTPSHADAAHGHGAGGAHGHGDTTHGHGAHGGDSHSHPHGGGHGGDSAHGHGDSHAHGAGAHGHGADSHAHGDAHHRGSASGTHHGSISSPHGHGHGHDHEHKDGHAHRDSHASGHHHEKSHGGAHGTHDHSAEHSKDGSEHGEDGEHPEEEKEEPEVEPEPPPEEDEKSLQPTNLVDPLLTQAVTSDAVQKTIDEEQKEAVEDGLFWRFHPEFDYKDNAEVITCKRVPVPMWERDLGMQLLVSVSSLKINGGILIEPFYCTLALYDLKHGYKLSENFHFDLNDPSLVPLPLGNTPRKPPDEITLCKHAIFSITDRHENVFLVLKIERILQEGQDLDIYLKTKNRSASELANLRKKYGMTIQQLQDYRRPFAFGLVPLFEDTGELITDGQMQLMDKLYILSESMKDADFMKMAREAVDMHMDKKSSRLFPNSYFEFRLDEIDADYPANRVDPSTIPLKNSPELLELKVKPRELKENEHPIVLEVQDYSESSAIPNSYFVNLLYIYPEFIEFEKFRNICCKVQVRESDASLSGGALEMIAGRSSGPAYVKEILTSVNYHLKATPQNDEIKVMLPLKIAQKAHIFFTFYKVSCKKKPGKREIIGYSLLPLYSKHQWLPDNVYNLAIAAILPEQNYYQVFLDMKENELVHYRRNGNPCFQVRVKLVSSLFCQDKALNDFFFTFPSEKELEGAGHQHGTLICQQAVDHFKEVSPISAIKFLPGIMSYLLDTMFKRPDELAQYYALVGLVYVVDRVSSYVNEINRCALLVSYITYRFRNISEKQPVWPRILHLWLQGLKKREEREVGSPDSPVDRLFIQYAWFFFETIFKSMALQKVDNEGVLPPESVAYFVRTFEDVLILFTRLMYRHRSTGLTALKHLVNNLALFFTDLFTVLDAPTVIHLFEVFMFEFREVRSDPVLVEFKFTFYGIIFDNEYFLDMTELKSIEDDEDPVSTIKQRYRLVALFIEDYAKNLQLSELIIREKVINSLRYILTKHDYDTRYQQSREKIAMLFLPLIPAMLEEMTLIREMDVKLQRSALISILWVIKHINPKLLSQWWKREDVDVVADFVSLLDLCLSAFAYAGVKVRENETELATILSPESMSSFIEGGEVPQGTVGEFKNNIESLMSNIHKSHSFKSAHHTPTESLMGGGKKSTSRSRLRAAKENASSLSLTQHSKGSISGSKTDLKTEKKGSRFSLGTSNKSSLRALRAKMANRRTGTFKRGSSTNTLTTTSRDYLLKLVRWEGALNRNVTRVILKTLQLVVNDFSSELTIADGAQPSEILIGVVVLFTSILKYNQATTFLLSFFPYLRLFCQQFGKACFQNKHMHRHLSTLVGQVFRHGTFTSKEVRKESIATSVCFLMQNLAADGHLGYLEVSLTVHMSKLVNEINDRGERYLKQVLGALKEIAPMLTFDDAEKSARFHSDLNTLLGRLSTILADSTEIARQEKLGAEAADPTTAENLIVQVADAFSHMPEIRIEWLSRLGHHHHDTGNFAEAGQCFKQIAELYASPAMEQQLAEQSADAAWKNITAYYELACKMLDKAELYEQCAEVYRALLPMYEQKRENKYLARCFLHLHQIYEKLIKADAEESRSLGSYYRVGFYGKKFGERLNGNEFIYKMPKITTLGEAMNRLKKVYSAQLGKEVTVHTYSGPIDTSAHTEDTTVMQVTYVSPWFDKNNSKQPAGLRRSYIDKHTNIDAFKFSTPFTKGKKTQASSLQEQYKRNVVLFVKHAFPCTMTAQPVIRRQETVLTPIETAIGDIKSRTRKMNGAANADETNAKTLTALLQGAVAPQVHGGTKEICYAFLDAPPGIDKAKSSVGAASRAPPRASVVADAPPAASDKPPTIERQPSEEKLEDPPTPEQQAALRQALRDFKMACQHVLDANRKLATSPDAQAYQTEMDGHFDRMCAALEPWIVEPKKNKSTKGKPARRAVRFG